MHASVVSRSAALRGALCGLAAAALFGLSAPLAKLLLGSVSPVLLAGLLYVGAALGLTIHRLASAPSIEAPLSAAEAPKLAAVVIAGGVVAPIAMLFGLQRVSALAGSLLLNLEAPFTVLGAVLLFREHLGRHAAVATALIVGGAAVLEFEPGAFGANTGGVILLAGACAAWALDNNLTQRISLKDPFAIVRVKTAFAGLTNTAIGLALTGGTLPPLRVTLAALVLGSFSYGVSVVLDAFALRLVGAAREAAYFATAPFVGALAATALLGDRLAPHDVLAMALMALGVAFLLTEDHAHPHVHEALEHEHTHDHDDDREGHHRHEHGPNDPPGQRHSHAHRHEAIAHDHAHVPDAHHRHDH